MKKKLAILLAVAALLALLSGCAGEKGENKLLVATSPDFAPMEFVSADPNAMGNDRYVGFDMLLARYIAAELGMELEIKPMGFDACMQAVSMGRVDMALSGFSWKPDRAENYNLSDYYYAGDNEDVQTLITLAANAGKMDTPEQLSGLKIGAQTGSLQEELAVNQLPDCQIVPFADLTTALMQLRNGDFAAMVVAQGNGQAIVSNNPDIALSQFRFEVDPKFVGNVVMLQKGNDELTAKVNAILAKSKEAGLWEQWYDEARNTAGIEVTYDDEGNAVGDNAPQGMTLASVWKNIRYILSKYWKSLLVDGLMATLELTLIAVAFGVVLGALVAILKMSKLWLVRFLVSVYVEVIRGTPILLQLYIFYFVLPQMLPFLNLTPFMWVAVALCVNSSAYVSEVIRSGIQAVDKGQTEAARSLGLSPGQTMWKIVMPQAVKNILPALGNEFIMILKETSLASTFFVGDIMTKYLEIKGATYLGFECLLIVGGIYLCITFPLSKLVGHFEKAMAGDSVYSKKKKV